MYKADTNLTREAQNKTANVYDPIYNSIYIADGTLGFIKAIAPP